MVTFYTDEQADVERCRESLASRQPITITAIVDDNIQTLTGVIMAIEPDRGTDLKSWRITMEGEAS